MEDKMKDKILVCMRMKHEREIKEKKTKECSGENEKLMECTYMLYGHMLSD
jgi:hypothetical protein